MPNSATVQDMVPPLATLETRSSLFPIGHRWSRRPPHLPPPTELRSSPAAAAAAKLHRCHSGGSSMAHRKSRGRGRAQRDRESGLWPLIGAPWPIAMDNVVGNSTPNPFA
uniref:Uncharacterized protein n=1 Tax=Oryza rufipogon TaxID=4529 RepID=A0A0E0PYZ9_ORYRU